MNLQFLLHCTHSYIWLQMAFKPGNWTSPYGIAVLSVYSRAEEDPGDKACVIQG